MNYILQTSMRSGQGGEGEKEAENSVKFKKHPPVRLMLDVFTYILSHEFHSTTLT